LLLAFEIKTGSKTTGISRSFTHSLTTSIISFEKSIPILTAATSKSSNTALICELINWGSTV